MTRYGYSRTSLGPQAGQDGAGQVFRLTESGIAPESILMDEGISGMVPAASRPEFSRLLSLLVPGDSVTVPELSRIGRSVPDVLSTIEDFDARGVALKILDIGLDLSTPASRMVVTVLAAVARMERDFTAERTKAKLAALKAAGVYPETSNPRRKAKAGDPVVLGRPTSVTPEKIEAAKRMKASGMKMDEIAAILGTRPSTLYGRMAAART